MHEIKPISNARPVRRGLALVWVTAIFVIFLAMGSLAVDYGRVQTAKTELLRAADAAARAGVASLDSGVTAAQNAAVQLAAANTVDGTPLSLNTATDIDFGNWDPTAGTFTVLTGTYRADANAIRVTAQRTAANGNPINLTWARMIGISTCDVHQHAIAIESTAGFAIVGLASLSTAKNGASGNRIPLIDSFDSTTGGYTTYPMNSHGNCSSNGAISLVTGTQIKGNCRPGTGQTVTNGAGVTGSTTPLNYTLNFPAPNPGTYAATNDNANLVALGGGYFNTSTRDFTIGSKTLTIPGGTYYINNLSWNTPHITFTGPVVFYVTGTTFSAHNSYITTYQNLPKNLKFEICNNATVTYDFDQGCYAVLYAPLSTVTTMGLADDDGAVVGNNLTMTVGWHVDEALGGAGVVGSITSR